MLTLALSTVFFGAVTPTAETAVIVACLLLGILWVFQRTVAAEAQRSVECLHRRGRSGDGFARPLRWVAAAILLYGLFTLVPLPDRLRAIFAGSWTSIPGAVQSFAGGSPTWHALSLSPGATAIALVKLAAFFLFFFVCLEGFPGWGRVRVCAAFLLVLAFGMSTLGVVQHLRGRPDILWARLIGADVWRLYFGPFVNRNHFAAWAGMSALLGLGYLLSIGHRRERDPGERHGRGGLAARIARPDGNLPARQALLGFMIAVISSAILLSMSRGGILSFLAGLTIMCLLLSIRGMAGRSWLVTGIAAAIAVIILWIGPRRVIEGVGERFTIDGSAMTRVAINRDTLRMSADHLLFGTGPGTFADVYPLYQSADPTHGYTYAHNDYLQLLAEWGVAGTALFGAGMVIYGWRLWRLWRRRRNKEVICLGAGAMGGIAVLAVHSTVEFNVHIPANALLLLFLAALAARVVAARVE